MRVDRAEIQAWMRSRRSIRKFKQISVPMEMVERILQTATQAPNAHNGQPWRFVVVTGEDKKKALAEAMAHDFKAALEDEGLSSQAVEDKVAKSDTRIMQTPVIIVLCLDTGVMKTYANPARQDGEYLIAVQSVAMAGDHLLLAAHAEGLGGVWNCSPLFAPGAVREALDLPETWEAQGMALLGYPVGAGRERGRKPIQDVAVYR